MKTEGADEIPYLEEIETTMAAQSAKVVKIHSVVDIGTGEKVMIQEAAGFDCMAHKGIKHVVDLAHMVELYKEGKLKSQSVRQMLKVFDDALEGINDLHTGNNRGGKKYIHRDIKEDNILVMSDGTGKLSDFGTMVEQNDDPRKAAYSGTPLYSAPELLYYHDKDTWNNVTERADVWSSAMMLQNTFLENKTIEDHPVFETAKKGLIGDSIPPRLAQSTLRNVYMRRDLREKYEKSYTEPKDTMTMEHLIWWGTRIDPAKRPSMDEFRKRFAAIHKKLYPER